MMPTPDATIALPRGCKCCAAGTTNVAELDRQRRRDPKAALIADMLANLDSAEILAARLVPAAGRRAS